MRLAAFLGVVASVTTAAHGLHQPLLRAPTVAQNDTPVDIPLEVFQVQAPLRESYNGVACTRTIVQTDFTASYGSPYVGMYTPPEDCKYTTVIFNMTVTSAGINYDRLSLLYFGDIELWRSTTAMPVRTGIVYTFSKDMTAYIPLLREEQKVIMQLDNIYNSVFTGNFNITITALFYDDDDDNGTSINPADAILPISSMSSAQNKTSVFSLPDGNASVALSFPRNVERAVVSVFASGNGNEEFWYTDVPAEFLGTFGNRSFANGYGPWREVQVLIDGHLAGFIWPRPTVFTGGISTGLWVPIVGIDALDLRSVDVDISPWLGTLCDGKPHTFELKVVGYSSTSNTSLGAVANNWYVSGQVFLWLDEDGEQTLGSEMRTEYTLPEFRLKSSVTKNSDGTNSSFWISLTVHETLAHRNTIRTSKGHRVLKWEQDYSWTNAQNFTAAGRNETLYQQGILYNFQTPAVETEPDNPDCDEDGPEDPDCLERDYTSISSSTISFYQAYAPSANETVANSTIYGIIDQGSYDAGDRALVSLLYPADPGVESLGMSARLSSTRQNGSCFYIWNNTYYEEAGPIDPAIGTVGATEQWFGDTRDVPTFTGMSWKQYGRYVLAADGFEPRLEVDERDDDLAEKQNIPEPQVVRGEGINLLPIDDDWGLLARR